MQVDPSVLASNRVPLQNPRIGDYNLKQTASTEGIASKKSLELKKRYLLGETATSGIMKSDSTSVLDSKFKNFRTTISDCQKLLNPAPDISPAMQQFLKNTMCDNKSSSLTETTTARESVKEVKDVNVELHKNGEEKENVYERIVSTKNELNKSDMELSKPPTKIPDYSETINTVLVENKLKEMLAKPIGTIDLTTPEKADAVEPPLDVSKIELSQKVIATNQSFVDSTPNKTNLVIDLTGDSPPKDVPVPMAIAVKVENPKYVEEEKLPKVKVEMSPERTKHAIDSMLQKQSSNQSRSPIHETSITVPKIPWTPKKNKNDVDDDVESDSLSSSSSSSVDDIPHYILDSTTSPDTQGDRFVPRLEVRDDSGELMQIDSLMIIDGKYVGDPEDLKHMRMPENSGISKSAAVTPTEPIKSKSNVSITNIESNDTKRPELPKMPPPSPTMTTTKVEINKPAMVEASAIATGSTEAARKPTIYRYESFSRKPDLKFDTKNENKIDTLKNLPLILPKELGTQPAKPNDLPIGEAKKASDASDNDKTPTVANPVVAKNTADAAVSDSETEFTGQVLTETELSDWTADDAVSENFVDIEFALNSNKGTIKRNKKSKRKHSSSSSGQKRNNGPTAEAPIVSGLDYDNIEFMDTGSEDSCVETFSATNKAMLKNRGYVQFVSTTNPQNKDVYKYKSSFGTATAARPPTKPASIDITESTSRSAEIVGVDYIEQGACVLGNDIDLKTPINEVPPMFGNNKPLEQHDSLNDIEDDSLVMVASQCGNTTTEESDALTVVTSPMESTPRNMGSSSVNTSFDKTGSTSSPSKKSASHEVLTPTNESPIKQRKPSQEESYEDYVRSLQIKICQISSARDSIDVRKTKRKQSIADSFDIRTQPAEAVVAVVTASASTPVIDRNNKSLSIHVNRPEPGQSPSGESAKLLELSRMKTKEVDLIHDLVLNKLQKKKQLNAEKRLNRRSRNSAALSTSSSLSPHNPSSCSLSYLPMQSGADSYNSLKMLESERRAGMHGSTKALPSKPVETSFAILQESNKHLAAAAKERPRSDNIEGYPVFETPKLNKTQSFCVYPNRMGPPAPRHVNPSPMQSQFGDNASGFSTPTEKLRHEARARARAKSNQVIDY